MRLLTVLLLSLCSLVLLPRAGMSQAAAKPTPTPTLARPGCGDLGGRCHTGPCDRSPIQPPAHLPGPHFIRTKQGVSIRLQPLPGNAAISGLTVNSGWAAWEVQTISGRRHSIRPRLYLARLDHFHPSIVASPSCSTNLGGPYLSAHWLVWTERHLTPYGRHDTLTIRALNLSTGHTEYWSFPYTNDVLAPGAAFTGDTLVWTSQQWEGQGRGRTLVHGIHTRTLPDGPTQTIHEVREHIGRFFPPSYVDGYVAPQIAGNLAVWQRTQWVNGVPHTGVLAATLPRGRVRMLTATGAESPVTNGWKVAWLADSGHSLDLMQLDTHTGTRKLIGQDVLPWTTSPQLGGTTLSWQTDEGSQTARVLFARGLITGRRYALVTWRASGAAPAPLKVFGPGAADGDQVVWEEVVRTGTNQKVAYLAVAGIPDRGGGSS